VHKVHQVSRDYYEYFCDVCGEEIRLDRSRDDQIDDKMKPCIICGREACFKCREYLARALYDMPDMCNDCALPRDRVIMAIKRHRALARDRGSKLKNMLLEGRKK